MAESKTKDIRDAIIGVLEPLQLDGEPAFTSVVGHSGGWANGYPLVQVLPGILNNEKAAYSQTERKMAFIVRTNVPQQEDGSDFDQMYPLVDLIINALDAADQDNALQQSIDTYMLSTTLGQWDYAANASGVSLMADINVEVTYSHNV